MDDRRKRANQRHAINDAVLPELLVALEGAGHAAGAELLSARYRLTLAPRLYAERWDSVAARWLEHVRNDGLVSAESVAQASAFLSSHQEEYARRLEAVARLGMDAAREAGSIYFMDSPVSRRYADAALELGGFNPSQWERFATLVRDMPGYSRLLHDILDPATGLCRSELIGPYHTMQSPNTLKGSSP